MREETAVLKYDLSPAAGGKRRQKSGFALLPIKGLRLLLHQFDVKKLDADEPVREAVTQRHFQDFPDKSSLILSDVHENNLHNQEYQVNQANLRPISELRFVVSPRYEPDLRAAALTEGNFHRIVSVVFF